MLGSVLNTPLEFIWGLPFIVYLLKVTKDNHLPVSQLKTRSSACISNVDRDVLWHFHLQILFILIITNFEITAIGLFLNDTQRSLLSLHFDQKSTSGLESCKLYSVELLKHVLDNLSDFLPVK